MDAGAKVRPTPQELQTLGEAFGREWSYFERAPDKPVICEGLSAGYDNASLQQQTSDGFMSRRVLLPRSLPTGEYFSTFALTARITVYLMF